MIELIFFYFSRSKGEGLKVSTDQKFLEIKNFKFFFYYAGTSFSSILVKLKARISGSFGSNVYNLILVWNNKGYFLT